ncbi:hypothetical protein Salat_2686900 [Sesamum alatum]|uniref:Uncharacterized protein n=1 Tax=Sesamum alatum TaxID=300844 RepID=A0AAE1XPP9_9LAMI|nr:hypothetical protein Salat_2686900 [Sesamum alatum]
MVTPELIPEPIEVKRRTNSPPPPLMSLVQAMPMSVWGGGASRLNRLLKVQMRSPPGSKKQKRKHKHKSKDSRSSKSSKNKSRSIDIAKKKAIVDADELEGFKLLKAMEAISDRSYALRTHAGEDLWELFKAILCDRDQALLSKQLHTKVKEHFAHSMMQACALGHNLSLKCSIFREEKKVLVVESATLKSEMEALKAQIAKAKASKRFDHGLTEGRARYLASDDHKALLATTRVDAARDFLKSAAFGITLEIKTAHFTIDSFELCRSQIKTLGGFVEHFDQNRLDPPWIPSFKFQMWANILLPSPTSLMF